MNAVARKRGYAAGYEGDGFEIRRLRADRPLAIGIRHWSRELERVMRESAVPLVSVHSSFYRSGASLDVLADFAPQITTLGLAAGAPAEMLAVISVLDRLEDLTLASPTDAIDFSGLRRLRECMLIFPASIGNIGDARNLRDLALFEQKGIRNLALLAPLRRLRRLYLNSNRGLASLEGIEHLPLRQLQVIYSGRLESIAPIGDMTTLRDIEIVGCSRIRDITLLGDLHALRSIRMRSGPALPSFDFARRLRELRVFSLENTDIRARRCSIAPLARLPRLGELRLYAGTKQGFGCITDVESLGRARALETLSIDRGPVIHSMLWVRHLTRLRKFSITRTHITRVESGVFRGLRSLDAIDY